MTRQFQTVSEEAYQTVEEPVPCRVMNLSASGAMIHARAEFQEGDWISLTGVKVLPEEPAFSFVCQFAGCRSVEEWLITAVSSTD